VQRRIDQQPGAEARGALRSPGAGVVVLSRTGDVNVRPRHTVDELDEKQGRRDRPGFGTPEVRGVRDAGVKLLAVALVEWQLPQRFVGVARGRQQLLHERLIIAEHPRGSLPRAFRHAPVSVAMSVFIVA
jgi:hypothetical protein